MKLLDDSVTEVRCSCFHSAAQVLLHLKDSPSEFSAFLKNLIGLATRPSFQSRQLFGYVVQQLVELGGVDVVENYMLEPIELLARDKVVNVRFVVARVLANSVNNNSAWKGSTKIKSIAALLASDADPDVAAIAKAQLPRVADPRRAAAYRL
jgi:hypothetical protein